MESNTNSGASQVFLFFREDMFYPVELENDADAIANAKINYGTIRVEDANGRVVWNS